MQVRREPIFEPCEALTQQGAKPLQYQLLNLKPIHAHKPCSLRSKNKTSKGQWGCNINVFEL